MFHAFDDLFPEFYSAGPGAGLAFRPDSSRRPAPSLASIMEDNNELSMELRKSLYL